MSAAEAQFNTIVKENEIKLSEQRKSKHGGVSTKLRGFLKPTGWKPLTILFLFFSFQQFSGIYITLFYAVTWFQVNNYFSSTFTSIVGSPIRLYMLRFVINRNHCHSGSWFRRGRVHSLDSSWCNSFPVFDGEYLAAKAVQEAAPLYNLVFGNGLLHDRFRLLYLSY